MTSSITTNENYEVSPDSNKRTSTETTTELPNDQIEPKKITPKTDEVVQSKLDDTTIQKSNEKTSNIKRFFSSTIIYLVLFSLSIFFQSMVVNGMINSVIPTIEKRFGLTSVQTSYIVTLYNIGILLSIIPISYYGTNHGYKPKWVGGGTIVMGLGALTFACPYFITQKYNIHIFRNQPILCGSNNTELPEMCQDSDDGDSNQYRFFLYLGGMLIGIGSSPLQTTGLAHIEETVSPKSSAIHIGISVAFTAIGPAFGYVLSGFFLNIYVDLTVPPGARTSMVPDNQYIWIGAWWIGFIVVGICQLLLGVLLCSCPRVLPYVRKTVREAPFQLPKYTEQPTIEIPSKSSVKIKIVQEFVNVFKIMKSIFTNFTYDCILGIFAFTLMTLNSLATYGPKYLVTVFGIKDSDSTLTTGIVAVPCLTSGALVGGMLIRFFKWESRGQITYILLATTAAMPIAFIFLLKCFTINMVGIDENYNSLSSTTVLPFECSRNCSCSSSAFFFDPSCGLQNKMYFSACFAGCSVISYDGNTRYFSNCTCLTDFGQHANNKNILTRSLCKASNCWYYVIFLVLLGVYLMIMFSCNVPLLTCTMRIVSTEHISVALGFLSIFGRLFGSIPGYLLMGIAIDSTCRLWGRKCGKQQNCIHYDTDLFSSRIFLIVLLPTMASVLFLSVARINILIKEKKTNPNKEVELYKFENIREISSDINVNSLKNVF